MTSLGRGASFLKGRPRFFGDSTAGVDGSVVGATISE